MGTSIKDNFMEEFFSGSISDSFSIKGSGANGRFQIQNSSSSHVKAQTFSQLAAASITQSSKTT